MAVALTDSSDGKTDAGLSDSVHSSCSRADRYRLNQDDTTPILLYEYRGGRGLQTTSQKELCARLEKDESIRATRIPIPRFSSYLDVKRHDLYLPEEKEMYRRYPNYDTSLAGIKLPTMAYWSRIVFGTYDSLYIVSHESSPTSSISSVDRRSSTWGKDSDENVKLGAERD